MLSLVASVVALNVNMQCTVLTPSVSMRSRSVPLMIEPLERNFVYDDRYPDRSPATLAGNVIGKVVPRTESGPMKPLERNFVYDDRAALSK